MLALGAPSVKPNPRISPNLLRKDAAPGGKPAMTRRDPDCDWSQGWPRPKPRKLVSIRRSKSRIRHVPRGTRAALGCPAIRRKGGYDLKIRSPTGGAVPRLNSRLVCTMHALVDKIVGRLASEFCSLQSRDWGFPEGSLWPAWNGCNFAASGNNRKQNRQSLVLQVFI